MLINTIFNSFIFILGVSPWFLVSSKSILSESEKRGKSAISPRNPEEENIEKLSRHRRNARSRREFLWRTRTIPYEISYSLRKNKEVIYEAIKEIQLKSCLSFVKRKPQDTNWITFELGDGCSSSVGKTYWRKGAQTIILDYPCLQKSTILHEMMHALGFWHEHSRPDRNEHIEIFWENIDTVNEINFEKFKNHEVDTLGIQYDLKSVMHYGNYAFSKNVKQTIKALKDKSITLGNENGLSALDVVKINALYDCSNKMSSRRNFMSSWSDWSSCDKNCYKQRQRFCMASDARKCKRANKHGIEKQVQVCSFGECFTPVDGHWGRWSSWSSCSVTCGEGVRSRSRKCTDPVPKFGGKSCGPKNTDTVKCKQRRCNLGPLDCDFESDSCHWANEASNYLFHWQRRSGETPSRFTGPKSDHTTGNGYYLYTESSFPASKGMLARFSSPEFHPDSSGHEKCMTFWVNFNGAEIGKFAVKQRFSSTRLEKTLWESVGKLGKEWKSIKLTIKGYSTYKIVFEASHPGSYLSDFAIDDVSFKDGACEADSVCAKEERPLGLEAGLINDRRMMATSMKTLLYRPEFARLNNKSAWCVDPNRVPNRHYLVVDLGHDMNVVSIATQGFRNLRSWVNKYQLWYKVDGGRRWTSIVYERKAKIFVGNTDAHSIVKNNFPKPIVARYIGVNPLSWSDSQDICLRLELYGCTLKTHPNRVNE